MENTWNWDKTDVDYSLLEKVNPVFNTAKMTLFQLAANGSADAAVLAKSMGLTLEATQNSTNTKASPEQVLGGTIMLETRYSTMTRLVEESGFTPVDIPCGYTPRAIEFARKGLPYYGLDLPVVIREISDRISALIPPEQREFVHYHEVDATNYSSLEKALEDIDGPVCITTEGLLMYFTDSEAGTISAAYWRRRAAVGTLRTWKVPFSMSLSCAHWWVIASWRSWQTQCSRRRTSRTWRSAKTR